VRRRIYVDIDDVLCHTALALTRLLEEHFGRRVAFEEVRWFDLARSFGLSSQDHERLMDLAHEPSVLSSYEPVAGAREVLESWTARGYDVALCTGRPASTAEATRDWLAEHRMPYGSVYFVDKYGRSGHESSLRLEDVAAMKFELAVEDSHDMATYLAGAARIPVALVDRPWNRSETHERIVRCSSWPEIARAFPDP
jgi:uncharacterized HAD superfamily protein